MGSIRVYRTSQSQIFRLRDEGRVSELISRGGTRQGRKDEKKDEKLSKILVILIRDVSGAAATDNENSLRPPQASALPQPHLWRPQTLKSFRGAANNSDTNSTSSIFPVFFLKNKFQLEKLKSVKTKYYEAVLFYYSTSFLV